MAATAPGRNDPVPGWVPPLVTAAGLGFALLLLLTIILAGAATPDRDAPVQEWSQFASDNETGLRVGALLFALAIYQWVLFLGVLRGQVGDAEQALRGYQRASYMVLAGGMIGIIGLGLGVFIAAASVSFPDASPEVIRAINETAGAGFVLMAAGFAPMFVTLGLTVRRLRVLPAWLSGVALLTGIAFLAQLGTLLSEGRDNLFRVFYPVGFAGLLLFTIGATAVFLRRLRSPSTP
jgi:hypothetical protein